MNQIYEPAPVYEDVSAYVRRKAGLYLEVPQVRLCLTLGVLFCICAAMAGVICADLALLLFFPGISLAEDAVSGKIYYTVIAAAGVALCIPLAEGLKNMAYRICRTREADLRDMFSAFSSPLNLLRAYFAAAVQLLRWALAAALVFVYFIFPHPAASGIFDGLGVAVTAAGTALALFWLIISRRFWIIGRLLVPARGLGFSAALKMAGKIMSDKGFRHSETAHRNSYFGICLLSLLTVCILFVFHTFPLTSVSWECLADHYIKLLDE